MVFILRYRLYRCILPYIFVMFHACNAIGLCHTLQVSQMEFLDIIKCHFFCFPAMVAAEKMKEESSAIVTTESLAAVKAFCSSLWLMDGKCSTTNRNAKHLVSPVLEGNAAFLFAATEALLQSFGGLIRLFPCVPPDFTGGFHKLRTHGAFELFAAMLDGKVVEVSIRAHVAGTIRLLNPWKNKLPELPSDAKVNYALNGKVILSRQLKTGSIWQLRLPGKY